MKREKRAGRARGRNLDDVSIRAIVELLDGWNGPLTWKLLIDAVEKRLHSRYTRQTLFQHARIYHAFQIRKRQLRNQLTGKRSNVSREMKVAMDTILRLKAMIERLQSENQKLLDQFVVWSYNAWIRGIDESLLNEPLPPVTPGGGRIARLD